jgi:hypothetical protein
MEVLTSTLDRGHLSALRYGRFTAGDLSIFNHCIGDFVGPIEGKDTVE